MVTALRRPRPRAAARPHLRHTHEERRAQGQARRSAAHRAGFAEPLLAESREVVALLEQAAQGRVEELLPIKWGRMAASPFAFYRGAAPLMAADLAARPSPGLQVQLCGDAHVRNLGAFAAPDGRLTFDLNDFDETTTGPFEWDLLRLAASVVLAGREGGGSERQGADAVRALVRRYRESMDRFAEMPILELARHQVHLVPEGGLVHKVLGRAERTTPLRTLAKLTVLRGGRHRFAERPPLLRRVPDAQAARVLAALQAYRETLGPDRQHFLDEYHPTDVAFKVVGTGSVGTRDYVVLLFGNGPGDPLFLQIKEATENSYVRHLPQVPAYPHQGRRVAEGQRRMQCVSDPFLGWTHLEGRDFLVRQLSDHKASVEPEELRGPALHEYGLLCGELLARAHARTGDAAAIAGYCGDSEKLDKAVAAYARSYADQTEQDHAQLLKAIRSGRLKARRGI